MVSTLVGADTKWGADIWLGVIFFRVTDMLEALASVNFWPEGVFIKAAVAASAFRRTSFTSSA
jgi:hypothetical protein